LAGLADPSRPLRKDDNKSAIPPYKGKGEKLAIYSSA
jgi:hypothetical protein